MQKVVQLLRLMRFIKRIPSRLTCMLFILTLFISLTANGQDFQNGKVNLELKSVSLKEAFAEIQKQSGVRFIYDQDIKKYDDLKITHSVKDITVKKAVELILKGTNLQYVPEGSHVMISEKPAPKPGSVSPNAAAGQGQGTGGLKGRVVEFETSQPLPGASVQILELNKGITTDSSGYYRFTGIRAGKYTLKVSFVSYTTENQTVEVRANRDEVYDIKLQGNNQLGEVVVTATGKTRRPVAHASERQVLQEIKAAQSVVSGISSEQISKSADRNAAEVVQKISGVTVMDDKFVIVRGLNPRYNLTYLNDNVAPSTEVYNRAFALDLIPSRIIDKILVYKSPSPENLADATGGVVKIYTKDAKNVKHFDIEIQTGYRVGTTFNSNFLTYKGGKYDFLGFDDGTRKLPSSVPGYDRLTLAKLTPSQYAKTFNPILTYQRMTALPNLQLTANYYNSFKLLGKRVSSLSSLSYKNEYQKANIYRQQGNDAVSFSSTDMTNEDNRNMQTAQISLLQNFMIRLHDSSTLHFKNFLLQQGINSTLTRLSYPTASNEPYFNKDNILSFNQRFLYAGNLGGDHYLRSGRHRLQWNMGYTTSQQSTPDQRVIRLTENIATRTVGDTSIQWRARGLNGTMADANYAIPLKQGIVSRLWMHNTEGNYNASVDYTYRWKPSLSFKVGTFQQWKQRKLYRRVYTVHEGDMDDLSGRMSLGGAPQMPGQKWWIDPELVRFREQDLSEVWSEKYLRDDYTGLRVADRTTGSDSYLGTEQNNSGYVAVSFTPDNRKIEIYGGMRYEYNRQRIGAAIPASDYVPGSINTPVFIDNPMHTWLPSVNIAWRPTDNWVVRASYGKTVNRTEFREVAPYQELDYENNVVIGGNPKLKSATVDNFDARIEFYPAEGKTGEMLSAGAFYKKLQHPIERINTSFRTSDAGFPTISFQNAASATIHGLEIEVHKKLDFIPLRFFRDLSFIGNLSLIKSQTNNDTTALGSLSLTPDKRPLQGQPPYIVNMGLYYDKPAWGTRISVIYNTTGTSIYAAGRGYELNSFIGGPTYRGSLLELPRHTLDMAFTQRLIKSWQVKFSIQNLLDQEIRMAEDFNFTNKYEHLSAPYTTPNGGVTRDGDNIAQSYKSGRYFLINLSYSF